MDSPCLFYKVGVEGEILDIAGAWDWFARGNGGGPAAEKASVLHRNLFEVIQGEEVRSFYRRLHQRLLEEPGRTASFLHRGDSPALRRVLRMSLRGLSDGVLYKSCIESEVPLAPPLPLDDAGNGPPVIVCSLCRDYRSPAEPSVWKPIELIGGDVPGPFAAAHRICPQCLRSSRGWVEARGARSLARVPALRA